MNIFFSNSSPTFNFNLHFTVIFTMYSGVPQTVTIEQLSPDALVEGSNYKVGEAILLTLEMIEARKLSQF